MDVKTKKAEQSEATRTALLKAARELFAGKGYADTGTEEIVQRAGVTRGALYHHFKDKEELFRAVFEELEGEFLARTRVADAQAGGLWESLHAAFQAFLDACHEPAMQRIVLIDGPSVLGWQGYWELQEQYSLGALQMALQAAIDSGIIAQQPVRPLAQILISTLHEGGLIIANAEDESTARGEVGQTVARLLDGLRV
jgi:AcrR family transcriptional regulator